MITDQEEKFTVIYNGGPVNIEILPVGNQIMYLVRFSDRSPMMITRAGDSSSSYLWTSVPKGRQELAEEIGELVDQHDKQNA